MTGGTYEIKCLPIIGALIENIEKSTLKSTS